MVEFDDDDDFEVFFPLFRPKIKEIKNDFKITPNVTSDFGNNKHSTLS